MYYLIKEALSEKKQILFDVSGDRAIDEVLNVLDDVSKKENISEFYRPIFYGAGIVDKKIYAKLKHYDVTLIFENFDNKSTKKIKKFIGLFRKSKFHNYKSLIKNDIRFVFANNNIEIMGFDIFKNFPKIDNRYFLSKMLKNDKNLTNFTTLLFKLIYLNPAYICFDQDKKAILETQKQANFIVSENSNIDYLKGCNALVKNVYIEGEKKY